MAKPTSQWACIAMLALMGSAFTTTAHTPARSRKLQIDKNSELETNIFQARDKAAQHHHSQTDKIEASASGCGGGIYGGGYGGGGTSIGFPNIFPFPGFPFVGLVPQVSTWGEGGGYGGSNNNHGMGVNCQCTRNVFPMQYVITPVYFHPMDPASQNNRRRDGPVDMAPGPSGN